MTRAAGPERRTMPVPPRPGGVEMATMVSSNSVMGKSATDFPMVTGGKNVDWRMAFLQGFLQKVGEGRGFLMGRLWWIGGETWWEDALILDVENLSVFSGLFFGRFQPKAKRKSPIRGGKP